MRLSARRWGQANDKCVVCIHGVAQHGGVFGPLAERLANQGHHVVAVDLRGHGKSGWDPPWNTARHVDDVLETLAAFGVRRMVWMGHSFGGRVATALASKAEDSTEGLILLDAALEISSEHALKRAEVDRLDWSFETKEGAVNALLLGDDVIATSRDTVAAYVEEDVQSGSDGRYRFSYCPCAVVVAWSEMCLPPPRIAAVPTLAICAHRSPFAASLEQRYRAHLPQFDVVRVPNGHNVLWESAEETAVAVERFVSAGGDHAAMLDPVPGYTDDAGAFRLLL
jgi:lipase